MYKEWRDRAESNMYNKVPTYVREEIQDIRLSLYLHLILCANIDMSWMKLLLQGAKHALSFMKILPFLKVQIFQCNSSCSFIHELVGRLVGLSYPRYPNVVPNTLAKVAQEKKKCNRSSCVKVWHRTHESSSTIQCLLCIMSIMLRRSTESNQPKTSSFNAHEHFHIYLKIGSAVIWLWAKP